jgi:hypothetical protein
MASTARQQVLLALVGGLALGLVPGSFASEPAASVGDRIQFSEHELPRGLVPTSRDPLDRAGRFESLPRGGSMGGVIERLPAPSSGSLLQAPSARMLEQMEQRRNWIYSTEAGSSFGSSAEQAMGVRSYDLSGAASSPRGGLGSFQQTERTVEPTAGNPNPLFDSRRDGLLFDAQGLDSFSGVGAGSWLDGGSRAEVQSRNQHGSLGIGGILSGTQPGLVGTARGQADVEVQGVNRPSLGVGSIQDLLTSPESINPLAGGFDPIDFRIDTTRQELNPTNPQRSLDGFGNQRLQDGLGSLDRGPTTRTDSGLSGILDRLTPDTQGTASLEPVVRAPADTRGAQPLMRFGEFPSRRF